MADGSIVFDTRIDNKEAVKDLERLQNRIKSLNEKIYTKQREKIPLVEQSDKLGAQLDAAKAKLESMRGVSIGTGQLQEQQERVKLLQAEWNKVQTKIEGCDAAIKKANLDIDIAKERSGAIHQSLSASGYDAEKMNAYMKKANKKATGFVRNIKSAIGMSLVFSFAFQAISSLTEWVGKVIQVNDEASAAVGRLKAAFLTLAQPLIDVILPAFTTLVNILTSLVTMASSFISTLFGSDLQTSKDAAENLYDETQALEDTGEAAEEASKSLASFDEINKLSSTTKTSQATQTGEEGIQPDFDGLDSDSNFISDMLSKVSGWVPVALMLGGIALIAIGAATANILVVVAGLALLGSGISGALGNEEIASWVDALGLNNVQEFVVIAILLGGIAVVAIGAAMGNIAMVVSGLLLIGVTVLYATQSGMLQDWAQTLGLSKAPQYVTAALLIGGIALVVIGAAMQNYLMIIAGLALIGAGVYVGMKTGVLQSWWDALMLSGAASYVTAALLIAGFAFVVFGIAMKNIPMIIVGVGLFASGIVVGIKSGTFQNWWEVLQLSQASAWITSALIIGGIALTVFGILYMNFLMFIGGLSMIFAGINYGEESGTFDNWWEVLGLENADTYVTAALLIGGMALVVFGIVTANVLMVIGGLAMLGVAAVYGSKTGTFKSWSEALHLDDVAGKVTSAIMLAGIALISIGAMMLNPVLVLAGLALLGVGAVGNYMTGKRSSAVTMRSMPSGMSFQSYNIPGLATGTVVPPNREFLARLGDNKQEPEVVSPLSTMKQAFKEALAESGGMGGGSHTTILEVDGKALGRVTYQLGKEEEQRIGTKLVNA